MTTKGLATYYSEIQDINKELKDVLNSGRDDTLIKRMKFMGKLPFWCDDTQNGECCFNHVIGLPRHPATGIECPLTPYQYDCFKEIHANSVPPKGIDLTEWKRESHKYHITKGRQMGFTEFVLRILYYYCCGEKYWGRAVGIIAGNTGALARKNLTRFKRLGKDLQTFIEIKTSRIVKLINGCVIEAFAASAESMTGDTKYAAIYIDEASKWSMINDEDVFNSILPIVETNGSDLFVVSTPKGPVKTFYKIWLKDDIDYQKMEYPIHAAEGNLYTKEQIIKIMNNFIGDARQEFECFTSDTEILTKDKGFVKFENLKQQDLVATLNTDNKNIEYQYPTAYIKKIYEGNIINFKNQRFDLSVTPNHMMLTYNKPKKNKKTSITSNEKFILKQANQLKNWERFYRTSEWIGVSPDNIIINGIKITTETYCNLMGYYLSEGSVQKQNGKIYGIIIGQTQGINYECMYYDLTSLDVKRHQINMAINNKKLGEYMIQFGYSHEKFIPNEIKQLSPKYIRIFLNAYLLGDGYTTKGQTKEMFGHIATFKPSFFYSTSSTKMRDDLMELILKVGNNPKYQINSKKGTLLKFKNQKKPYYTNYDVYKIHEAITKYSSVKSMDKTHYFYQGYVYCVTVPKYNTIYVRHNGQCTWSGNCQFSIGANSIFGFVEEADRGTHKEWDEDDKIVWNAQYGNDEDKKLKDDDNDVIQWNPSKKEIT